MTPHTYAESGGVFRRFVAAAGLQQATILTADVGGLALCCDELRLVDLASLSNRKLAHRGPTALADVLETESPDLVEAHWKWASLGALYDLPYFRAHYVPAFGGGTRSGSDVTSPRQSSATDEGAGFPRTEGTFKTRCEPIATQGATFRKTKGASRPRGAFLRSTKETPSRTLSASSA